ncbi:MAG TPA: DUF5715 family protein [Pyrinomonadaceae bacterium]|nr:DUF5715 family protein [Pyrinomonadaceae bacterium]
MGIFVVLVPVLKRHGSGNLPDLADLLPTTARAAEVNNWTAAVEKVKEDRGEPVGKQAKIDTPSELRHYSDTRRFLATQVAEVKEHSVSTPRDLVALAAMVERGELVQLPLVSENYILFGVGGNADGGPFTRYEQGESVGIYDEAALSRQYAQLSDSSSGIEKELSGVKIQLAGLKKRDRAQRVKLQAQTGALQTQLKTNREAKIELDRFYGTASTKLQFFADYEALAKLGAKLSGTVFDIESPVARRQLKVRLLASLRPEAKSVLEQVAASYHEKFGRPLPITSLVRPDEYQLQLSKINANATRIETPPHSTGLAFDILYRYMTAEEQSFVMTELARLKDEGKIEVLRENRDHYHVFAFVDGARPAETFISASLGEVRSSKPQTVQVAKSRIDKNAREAHHSQKKTTPTKRTSVAGKRKAASAKSVRRHR